MGYADVYIDGVLEADNIDCYDPSRHVALLYENNNLSLGPHTIKVVVAGEKNSNSSNTFLVHDFFESQSQNTHTVILEEDTADYSGTWNISTESIHSGTAHYGNSLDGYFEHTFTGTSVSWYGLKNADLGYANIYIDGVLDATNIDCYSNTKHVTLLYEKDSLPFAPHTIRITLNSLKNLASAGTYLVHDYIECSYPIERKDIKPDGVINLEDFCYLGSYWNSTDCNELNGYCLGADISTNGTVDIDDLQMLINDWMDI